MIHITCGTCGTSQGYKTRADGPLSFPAPEEARLVSRGVASYVTKPVIGPDASAATPVPAYEDTAKLQEGEAEASDDLEIVDGHFTTESLMRLTRADMEKLAESLGVDISKCRNKGEIAEVLSAVELQDGDDTPPDLSAEGPVV